MSIQNLPICSRNELDSFIDGKLMREWKRGRPTLFRVETEHVNSRIETAVKSVISNNGTYQKRDRVLLNSRPDALPLAVEMGNLLEKQGYQVCLIYSIYGDPVLLNKLLQILPDRKQLDRIVDQYKVAVEYAQHWVVPYATPSKEPNKAEREAVKVFMDAANKGLSGLDGKIEKGEIKSRDIIGFPVAHEAKRLGLSISEWEKLLYKAMGTAKGEVEREIDRSGYAKVLGQAFRGKTLKIVRKGNYPVNLTMRLKGRPIFKDIGRVGKNTIFGEFGIQRITNIPPGELFMAPLENGVNGEFSTKIPQVTERGAMEGVHIVFKDGRVVEATATKGEDALHFYTGLAKPETKTMKRVYQAQNTIAELGIGMNPVLDFEKTTGSPLIDEKMRGIHIATGMNKIMGGATPGSIGGVAVDHWDFMVGKIDEMTAI